MHAIMCNRLKYMQLIHAMKSWFISYWSILPCVSASKEHVSEERQLSNDRKNRTSSLQDGVRFRSGGGNSRREMDGRIHAETVQDTHGQLSSPLTLRAYHLYCSFHGDLSVEGRLLILVQPRTFPSCLMWQMRVVFNE